MQTRINNETPPLLSKRMLWHVLALLIMLSGCTAMKYVPDNQALYVESDVQIVPSGKVRAKKKIKELLYTNINPKPNTTILGMRPTLWVYYAVGPQPKKKSLKSFIKNKIGQAPVYMSDVDPDKTVDLLRGHLQNNGYFQADVKSKTEIKNKKGKVYYTAYVHRPYRIRKISTPAMDTLFANIDSLKNDSYLQKGQRYNLERLQAEQERLEEALENLGFYFFDDRHLIFEADSTVGDKEVDLMLTLEPGVPAKAKKIYRLQNVNIFPDFTLSLDTPSLIADTAKVSGFNYISKQKQFRPKVITDMINLRQGHLYKRLDEEYTVSHLMAMGSFKFVNIKFIEVDSATLDANVYLTPFLKKSIRAEFQATSKSNNFVGPGLSITFTNRNAFRGSERLDINLNTGYEVQVSRKQNTPLNAIEIGGEAKLTVPRLLVPFKIDYPTRKYLPTTDASLGARIQQRIGYFNLNTFNFTTGYTWRENTLKSHEFYPIDVNYVDLGKTSPEFDQFLADNTFIARSFEDQFIPGARYSYTLNTQLNEERAEKFREQKTERSHFYFNGRVDVSGNLIHALQGKGFEQDADLKAGKILGATYSQFTRGEIDFRHYYNFDEDNQFVSRINAGVGYAYGNSLTMPYVKQFAIGGSTSLRAFPARSVGPGTYNVRDDNSSENQNLFVDQRGDVKLEANAEFRYAFTKTIKSAVFIDAGNIWLLRDDPEREGEKFEKEQFLDQLAVGTGAGLRFDFNFFVLRFDLAFPLRKPWQTGNEWVYDDIDLGSSTWRQENLILNIAIGYPF